MRSYSLLATHRIISEARNFLCIKAGTSSKISIRAPGLFAVHFLNMDKVLFIGAKQHHSWILLIFQLVKKVIGYSETAMPGFLEQALSFHHTSDLMVVS